jgi:poly(3-hydroxybutyrate) depolymerase
VRRHFLLLPALIALSSCSDAGTDMLQDDFVLDRDALAPDAADASDGDVADARADAADSAADAGDAPDADDSALRWDILLPDAQPAGDLGVDASLPPEDRGAPTIDAGVSPDRPDPITLQDVPRDDRPDVVVAVDRPDVVVAIDRPDVVIAQPDVVVPVDRPDVVIAMDRPDVVIAQPDVVVPVDRPDVVIAMDRPDVVIAQPDVVVPVDRPDVVVPVDRPDVVVAIDRPDVVVADTPDVVVMDRPDVVTVDRPDVVTVDRPDVVTVDRPDVVTVDVPTITDLGAPTDAGGLPGPDPVSYTGTFTARTGSFTANITVNGSRRAVRLHVPTNAGTSPPLLLLFHGTNGDGSQVMTESNAVALANAEGVIVAAPSSRWLGVGDFDHATEETYWETQRNTNPDTNEDVLLVRAIMVEAQRVYGVDATRIYAMGHSNGAFFAGFIATLLRDRIAAFSENSGGLVTCARTTSCRFQGAGTTCATLATRAGWCNCSGPELPMPLATTGRRVPGYITHGTNDPLVSVYYSCTLQARMLALGMPVQISLFSGEGHVIPTNWAQMVWPFFRPLRLTP